MSNQQDRVLGRRGARIVTTEEAKSVKGGAGHTATVCTFDPKIGPDGDVTLGEC